MNDDHGRICFGQGWIDCKSICCFQEIYAIPIYNYSTLPQTNMAPENQ